MSKSYPKPDSQKPLFTIQKPVAAKVYRAKFKAFESTKFLDVKSLKSARHATIECGTIDIAGKSVGVAAEIKKGKVVKFKLLGCKGCEPKSSKRVKGTTFKLTLQSAGRSLLASGNVPPVMPFPVKITALRGFQIPIGSIIIIILGPVPFDICIPYLDGRTICWVCIFLPGACISF